MNKKQVVLHFTSFDRREDLVEADQELLKLATQALGKSFAPYSNFQVGAAARLANGAIVSGANCENASYPLCICAEPATLAAAASAYPGIAVVEMAITVFNSEKPVGAPATPCGACRQMLVEHENRFDQPIRLILQGQSGPIHIFDSASSLLPFSFSGDFLN